MTNTTLSNSTAADNAAVAERLTLTGQVQGVGFRPFVYRLAQTLDIRGWVRNELGQVILHVQAPARILDVFRQRLLQQAPPLAKPILQHCESTPLMVLDGFTIETSEAQQPASIHLPPDYYLCPDCERELFDPGNRRYRYPFINCTQCGPRYTLIKQLPYDRANTSMAEFTLCPSCRQEYENPGDRRFHAEPIACPVCGPRIQYYAASSGLISESKAALACCIADLRHGRIVAVKGIGGYHLLCDASDDAVVLRLRQRKSRPDKPLAVMFPPRGRDGLDGVRQMTNPDAAAEAQLRDPMRPIVLVAKGRQYALSAHVAPGLQEVGVFLPYSPLHRLLLQDYQGPLVVTSANISGEPVLTNNQQVERRLAHVADAFLHHNRPIERPADDSVFRVVAGKPRPLRLGRGIAPLELTLAKPVAMPTLLLGGHMKNSLALAWTDRVVVSPHIGDLDAPRSLEVFQQVANDLQSLYQVQAQRLVCDAHPSYASHRWACQDGRQVSEVLHHHAHAGAVAGEYPQESRWLVFTWDGTGYGEDATIWGGETFYGEPGDWQRLASLRPFYLPGGDRAGREPWRSALALSWETRQEWTVSTINSELLYRAWEKRLNSPACSSVGRLFDAAAAILGLPHQTSYEAQAAMQLEALARQVDRAPIIDLPMSRQDGIWRADWSDLFSMLKQRQFGHAERAACFHRSLARFVLKQCQQFADEYGDFAVGLSGGVFQNRLLTELAMSFLADAGFRVYLPQRLPCNDGGLCYGQAVEMAYRDHRSE